MLQMYFCMDYWVTDKICIRQPTVGEIVRFGEKKMYSILSPFITNPTSCRVMLWDAGINWNKITDFDLFVTLSSSLAANDMSLIFGETDFTRLKWYRDKNGDMIWFDQESGTIINKQIYSKISNYLRTMFNIHPKTEKIADKLSRIEVIDEERKQFLSDHENKNGKSSSLMPLISAMINHPGFKYNKKQLEEVGIVEFMDSVNRLQVYENTMALMSGMYSGMIDVSKINKNKELNWLRDLYSVS